jgi:glycerophosphoryl diester phosphodiesterase
MTVWSRKFFRVGHAGAGALARPNTLESFELAMRLGVDIVEFDVLPCRDALVLSHDERLHLAGKSVRLVDLAYDELYTVDPSLAKFSDAIDLIRGRALMNVDLKSLGYEQPAVELLRDKHALGEAMFSTTHATSLVKIRALEPEARTSISYPRDRGNAARRPRLKHVVLTALRAMKRTLPYRITRIMHRSHASMTTLNHFVISRATVERVHRIGGQVIAWTVDDLPTMRKLMAMGVDGITSNRPDLFGEL